MRQAVELLDQWMQPMPDRPAPSDPAKEIAMLQDSLYDLIVTRVAQAGPQELPCVLRDAHEVAASLKISPTLSSASARTVRI